MDAPPIQYARTSDGLNIDYCAIGDGPTLVLQRQPTLSHVEQEWRTSYQREFYLALARHFRVVDFDIVGTGQSSPTPPGYTLQDWTDDLRDLMDALEIPRAHLHGTSTGGSIGLQFAAQHPERVVKLVLVARTMLPPTTRTR